ncbi:hypothetical protein GCM10010116_20840 [Microbispora rosea subsp. aerata]|nr:hypothetical protein GCM10010116_20840 [Microbispora rosea subsp. aerata]GIH53733.1 hypothetical protein Mro02_06470 [Microbispora rosea subsp. aerata]GLJ81726.1 hypothetical protein GCM10017588_04510 [Microbispora rosea subsp. aerata]
MNAPSWSRTAGSAGRWTATGPGYRRSGPIGGTAGGANPIPARIGAGPCPGPGVDQHVEPCPARREADAEERATRSRSPRSRRAARFTTFS